MLTIPQRTGVAIAVRQVVVDPTQPIRLELHQSDVTSYYCLDCDFTSAHLDIMIDHQERQAYWHTRWQRIHRPLHMLSHVQAWCIYVCCCFFIPTGLNLLITNMWIRLSISVLFVLVGLYILQNSIWRKPRHANQA